MKTMFRIKLKTSMLKKIKTAMFKKNLKQLRLKKT